MSDSSKSSASTSETTAVDIEVSREAIIAAELWRAQRLESKEWTRWWIKLISQPTLVLIILVMTIVAVGVAQKTGLIQSGSIVSSEGGSDDESVTYICPMMCAAPQSEPGRCPVCAMELVPATSNQGQGMADFIEIEPTARRIANIQTVQVLPQRATRKISAIGEIGYDETRLRTMSAYFDGRIDRLYADYTGAVVAENDRVALVYSPQLFVSQVEFLIAREGDEESDQPSYSSRRSTIDLGDSSRTRLVEFGMSESQINALEESESASSRLDLLAPIGGTIIKKYVVEGQYIYEGQPICDLADLTNVWLMLELFPEDAALVRYGQKVEAEIQSLPGSKFAGRVSFIDTDVDPETRTVGVRVDIPNQGGRLRVGDFGRASIQVPLNPDSDQLAELYDPELAGRWICPKHPHETSEMSGDCEICNAAMIATTAFGYVQDPAANETALLLPRDAVLLAGEHSVVYVETSPGRFELRQVVVGPINGNQIAILDGVEANEFVATRGNFLIDSQMQLSGNPSLIDPTKATSDSAIHSEELPAEVLEALAGLPEDDRELAQQQRICPITEMLLGSMGTPPKIEVEGREVFLCCIGCESRMRAEPETYFAVLDRASSQRSPQDPKIAEAMSQLLPDDRVLAEAQVNCPVADYPLGGMGVPIKVDVNGTDVFICCEGCRSRLLAEPAVYLAKLESPQQESSTSQSESSSSLPPIGPIRVADEGSNLPPIPNQIKLVASDENDDDEDSGDDSQSQSSANDAERRRQP